MFHGMFVYYSTGSPDLDGRRAPKILPSTESTDKSKIINEIYHSSLTGFTGICTKLWDTLVSAMTAILQRGVLSYHDSSYMAGMS